MATLATSLYERSLELAAGVPVNRDAYEAAQQQGLNLAKLQALGKAYRQGWLHNVLARITPLTARETTDYELMASLFIQTEQQAQAVLEKMSADLSRFATLAGVSVGHVVPLALLQHVNLYSAVAGSLEARFGFTAPAPFGSTTIDAAAQAEMPFIRQFVKQRFAA